jgi:hypothetical protein
MERTPLLPLSKGMLIDQIQNTETSLMVRGIATYPTSCCPLCSHPSASVHSCYSRMVANVPCEGCQLPLCFTVRKFFCQNALCHSHQRSSSFLGRCYALPLSRWACSISPLYATIRNEQTRSFSAMALGGAHVCARDVHSFHFLQRCAPLSVLIVLAKEQLYDMRRVDACDQSSLLS